MTVKGRQLEIKYGVQDLRFGLTEKSEVPGEDWGGRKVLRVEKKLSNYPLIPAIGCLIFGSKSALKWSGSMDLERSVTQDIDAPEISWFIFELPHW
ncbi:hypothetical protein CEXT_793571 [Caerostris extrusa]|uniref:Uncharacterized protein n=1 Tax=Caerostris extrusa TaxID=172846 RepID=A0AAV4ND52_CAEEX|nr:hypothetical protein CEXT_793571 [Caerostris extrusa]